jgi:1-acyl-sn-glycerol-3-phosphate acyltransferase
MAALLRFLGKVGVFKVPIIGRILLAAGQVPVERETPNAGKAVDHAKRLLESGHLLGVYPEGTLSRDADHWPMIAKTGLAQTGNQHSHSRNSSCAMGRANFDADIFEED